MPSYFSVATRARASISLRIWFAAYRSYKRIYHPFVDLGIRLSVTQFFLHSAMVQAMTWHDALYLAGDKYSVSWLSPSARGVTQGRDRAHLSHPVRAWIVHARSGDTDGDSHARRTHEFSDA